MRSLFGIIFLLALASCQNETLVKGTVYDENNQPLEAVKVMVNGTDIFTYSDKKGQFEIDTKDLNDELMFEKEGYELKFAEIINIKETKIIVLEEKTD